MIEPILLVTGMSGAGKTEVMKALEDVGFFCVDNLPPPLLQDFSQLQSLSSDPDQRVAVAMDVRGRELFPELLAAVDRLEEAGVAHNILFLDCADDVLVRRYSETRRRHPMREGRNLFECIAAERALLAKIRARANLVLDTTGMKPHQLRERLGRMVLDRDVRLDLVVDVMSFGFKHGVPLDADLMFDVRFLANPYYEPALRPQTGLDAAVADYVFAQPEAGETVDNIASLLERWIPLHAAAGKVRLTVAIGCTGGQHRSVALATVLAERLAKQFNFVSAIHRDMRRTAS